MRSRRRTPSQLLVNVFALHPTSNSFRINISKEPRKCSFQRTYGNANSFRIRIYAKWGGWGATLCFSPPSDNAHRFFLFSPVTSHESPVTAVGPIAPAVLRCHHGRVEVRGFWHDV